MTLSEQARDRLADLVELQPTKNAELQDEWGLDSGSDVHQYLESELGDYYFRNDDSLICATPEAEAIVGDGTTDGPRIVSGSKLQRAILDQLPGPDEEPQSVVATLHDIQDANPDDLTADEVTVDDIRSALHGLSDRGLAERVRKSVPTFRLALNREDLAIEVTDEEE